MSDEPVGVAIGVARSTAIALFVVDVVFAVLHVAHKQSGTPASALWRVDLDRTYPETFQYLQFAGIAIGLVVIARVRRIPAARPWAAIFGLLVIDDVVGIHERIGEFMGDALKLPVVAGLRPSDLAEMLVAGVAGVATLAAMAHTWRSGDRRNRWLHARMGALLVVFAVFAVVVDAVHMLSISAGTRGLGLIEDGGEMFVASVILAFVVGVAVGRDRTATGHGSPAGRWEQID